MRIAMRHAAAGAVLLTIAAALSACTGTRRARVTTAPSYTAVAVPAGDSSRILRIRVPSQALAGNLLGDNALRNVVVYVPPDYATSPGKRYRTLYLLHGFGAKRDGQNAFVTGYEGFHLGHSMDSLYAAGTLRDLIVIAPDASNRWGGAFYRDSPVSGGWETFISKELVGVIDASFRTIVKQESRGLAGHSMGGFGTLSLIARVPGVFGAAYAMSPCCIEPATEAGAMAPVWRVILSAKSAAAVAPTGFYGSAMMGLATAYSPNPNKPPLFIDTPFRLEGGAVVPDSAVVNRWMSQSPLRLLDSLSDNLKGLRALAFDAGRSDDFKDIPLMVPRVDSLLTRKGVKHSAVLYDGDHSNRIGVRMKTIVLPFFGQALSR